MEDREDEKEEKDHSNDLHDFVVVVSVNVDVGARRSRKKHQSLMKVAVQNGRTTATTENRTLPVMLQVPWSRVHDLSNRTSDDALKRISLPSYQSVKRLANRTSDDALDRIQVLITLSSVATL